MGFPSCRWPWPRPPEGRNTECDLRAPGVAAGGRRDGARSECERALRGVCASMLAMAVCGLAGASACGILWRTDSLSSLPFSWNRAPTSLSVSEKLAVALHRRLVSRTRVSAAEARLL